MSENKEKILAISDLDITFKTTAGPVHAIRGINIDLYKGESRCYRRRVRVPENPSP